jgi:protein O-GlcNAc transferase
VLAEQQRGDAIALVDRGNLLQSLQHFHEAVECYDRALQVTPDFAVAFNNRGNALRALRRFDEALADFESALQLKPAFPPGLNNRGNVLRDMGRLQEALDSFTAALALSPGFAVAQCNRGHTLLDLKRPGEALACFEALLQDLPDDGEALFGRAAALLQSGQRLEQAAADFERSAAFGIERTEALVGQASVLAELQRYGEAAKCLAEVLAVAPEREYVRGSLLYSRLRICDWDELPARGADLISRVRRDERVTYPLLLLSLTDSPEQHLAHGRSFVAYKYPEVTSLGPCVARVEAGAGRPLRVAYLSADFRDHPVSHLLVGALERHDREHFEVLGVSLRAGEGGVFEQRLRGAFDRFIDASECSDRDVAHLLREREVDIAVDLMGFTQGLRPGIFAHRAAPVQVSYLGYAGTLGAPYMDYLLADAVVIPPEDEPYYSEKIVRLPHCYLPNDDRREIGPTPTRAQAGLPESGLVLCAFTNAYKINPPVFDIWMRLLREVPQSVLWLRGMGNEARENLLREAQTRGVEGARLIFAPHVPSMAEHLGRHRLADLYLDTLPYNAHSTACDALWAGVPVLTCAGRSFAARVAASALTAVGLPELITHSLEEYERRALELAQQPQRLQELRTRLEQRRLSSPLFDTARLCRGLEAAYLEMHERVQHRDGGVATL